MAAALTPLRIWLKDLFVLLLSMVPIAENRLAIPVAAALRLKWQQAFLCTTAGSFLPVPYVMKGSGPLADRARRVGFVERGLGRVERFAQKHPGLFRVHPCRLRRHPLHRDRRVDRLLRRGRARVRPAQLDGRHPRRHGDLGALYHRVHLRGDRRRENALPVCHPGRMNLEAEGRGPQEGSGRDCFTAQVGLY